MRAKYTGLHALRHFYALLAGSTGRKTAGSALPPKTVQERLGALHHCPNHGYLFAPVPREPMMPTELASAEAALLEVSADMDATCH